MDVEDLEKTLQIIFPGKPGLFHIYFSLKKGPGM
jgi:hypothetical protein